MESPPQGSAVKRRIRIYAILALIVWSLFCCLVLLVNDRSVDAQIEEEVRVMARASIDKDIAYRHWVAQRGGVYARVSDQLRPNPYLKVPERDIKTPSGIQLTLVNPAYMTRQVFEQDFPLKTTRLSHITSLSPLRPANAADAWESEALRSFDQNHQEYGEFWNDKGESVFRFMRPLWVEEACLRCHAAQGYKVGDLRGGISVMIPVKEFIQSKQMGKSVVAVTLTGIWLAGLLGISFSWRRISEGASRLQHEYDNMQLLFEAAPNGMLLFDHSLEIQRANKAFIDHYCQAESPCGQRLGDILHCENAHLDSGGCSFSKVCQVSPIREALLAALEKGTEVSVAECLISSSVSGQPSQTFLYSVKPLRFENQQGVLLSLSDISAQRQAEQEREKLQLQMLQAQKVESIGRLAGGVAHDFNNMLATILGNVELAQIKLEPLSPARDHLAQIKDAAKRSTDLTRQLLGFARQQTMQPQVLVLNDAIEEMLKILRRLIGEDIELIWKGQAQEAKLFIDPSQLNQILTNLVVNARDAIATTGTLELSTDRVTIDEDYCAGYPWARPGHYVQLLVSDNGCGMSKQVMEHIFEPFYTTKDFDKGTGLGLATVYGIVKQNNGFLNVYSEPEVGTTFRVYFPECRDEMPPESASEERPILRGEETILLVEDEVVLLEIGQRMLEAAGDQV
ncbi:MAG: DUF3365 domain-containing protein, partial [Geopsychrobacter sp.]|nr:DUF3365 domain-containing protein [Geopsychrobacter sp.]